MERQWARSIRVQGLEYSKTFLPVTLVKEYVYCPRYAFYRLFLEKDFTTESMWDAKKFTIDHMMNALKDHEGEILAQVRVRSKKLGLHGVVDLLILSEGKAKIVEAKLLTNLSRRSLRRRHIHIVAQTGAYAMCVEETLGVSVTDLGFIGKDYKLLWLPYSPWIKRLVEEAARGLHHLYETEEPPPRQYSTKCYYCCYRNICWEL